MITKAKQEFNEQCGIRAYWQSKKRGNARGQEDMAPPRPKPKGATGTFSRAVKRSLILEPKLFPSLCFFSSAPPYTITSKF